MRSRLGPVVVAALLLISGCALNLPPVRLQGEPLDLEQLVGSWVGEYASDDPDGRSGTITFVLNTEAQVAHGDVLMKPRGSWFSYQRYMESPTGTRTVSPAESLTISFVITEGRVVTGELDPYWDPDRQVQARTTFRGVVTGDVIVGHYETRHPGRSVAATGRWHVSRIRK